MKTQSTCFAPLPCFGCLRLPPLKVIAIGVLALSAFRLSAQEAQPTTLDAATNIVKSPLTIKGLYQNRGKPVARPPTADDAVARSLRFFKEAQNADGSWGTLHERSLATPLVLLSFLARGETAASHEFGNTVAHAREWLLNASPTGTAERLAAVVSLSAYCDLSYVSAHPEQKTNEVEKIRTILAAMPATNDDVWVDFAACHTMPADLSKPSWMRRTKEAHNKHLDVAANNAPLTLDEYLQTYLASLATFHRGGKRWQEMNRTVTPELMKRQQADGGYPVADGQNRFAATALATLRLEIYYQHAPQMLAKPEAKATNTMDQEIRVDAK